MGLGFAIGFRIRLILKDKFYGSSNLSINLAIKINLIQIKTSQTLFPHFVLSETTLTKQGNNL